MPCRYCKMPVGRSELSHSLTTQHRKKLFAKMKDKKNKSVQTYGWFKWEDKG